MVARSPARHGAGGGGLLWPRPAAWLCVAAALGAVCPPRGSLVQGRRLICWQAVLQCQGEPECSYAYNQYAEACAPVLLQQPPAGGGGGGGGDGPAGAAGSPASRRRCPSHCIAALIQLNHTRRGPALEDCDCAQDENCRATKRAIEPCLPRTSSGVGGAGGGGGGPGGGPGPGPGGGGVMGCTEARRRCDWDSRCSQALNRYMTYCGKLFNGLRCTAECRAVIEDMLAVPKAVLLNDCVCDGLERPICESVKENMARLCFGADTGSNGAGSSGGSDGGLEEYYDEDYEEEPSQKGRDEAEDNAGAEPGFPMQADSAGRAAAAWALLASILLRLLAGL
ncbi:growth arrest-specific protein 1 [Cygnus atratus]|nr:growth arrest-specific protein 1 [Cygnus atratus]